MTKLLIGIVAIILVAVIFGGNKSKEYKTVSTDKMTFTEEPRRDYWDLFIYSSENPNTDYKKEETLGFVSQEACINEGEKRTKSGGSYECGYQCRKTSTTIQGSSNTTDICKKICTLAGCRD